MQYKEVNHFSVKPVNSFFPFTLIGWVPFLASKSEIWQTGLDLQGYSKPMKNNEPNTICKVNKGTKSRDLVKIRCQNIVK